MQNRYDRVCNPVGGRFETVIQTGRRLDILLPVLLLLWFAGPTSAATYGVPGYAEIKAAVDAAYQARCDLLKNATGVVHIHYRLEPITREHFEGSQDQTDQELCLDPEPFPNRHAETTTTWYTKGNLKRFDILSPKPTDVRAILLESNRRTATDSGRSICYDVLRQEAYLDRPSPVYANPFGQTMSFDIHQLYQFNSQTVPELLYRWCEEETKSGRTHEIEITREKLGPTECIKVYCHPAYTYPSGERRPAGKLELWLAPKMAYSLVKARRWCGSVGQSYFLQESCDASYEQSPTHRGIWVLKTLDYVSNQMPNEGSEVLKATFKDTRVGAEIPEETFTFDGLGVPPGTVVYDKSRGGTYPPHYYRGMTPVFPRYCYMGRGRLVEIDRER